MDMMGVGIQQDPVELRAQEDCFKKEGETQRDTKLPTNPSSAQALQRHLYVIKNA
jgi:hypothetical protein